MATPDTIAYFLFTDLLKKRRAAEMAERIEQARQAEQDATTNSPDGSDAPASAPESP